jgi:hypothetical protein
MCRTPSLPPTLTGMRAPKAAQFDLTPSSISMMQRLPFPGFSNKDAVRRVALVRATHLREHVLITVAIEVAERNPVAPLQVAAKSRGVVLLRWGRESTLWSREGRHSSPLLKPEAVPARPAGCRRGRATRPAQYAGSRASLDLSC